MEDESKKLRWYNLSLMGFVMIWGFGNVVNNFANQGLKVVFSWLIMISIYFVPYVLMVGELGSTFKDGKAGVSSWIRSTMGPTLAYFAGWTYWVVHIPYLAQKPQSILIALSWAIFQDGTRIKSVNPMILQSITLILFFIFLWVASRGINSLKKIGTIAGTSIFVMSILYILLVIAAPALRGMKPATENLTFKTFIPEFNFAYFTTISMLVFAVGGCEKISPYVNNTKNPSKEFPKGMIVLAAMVGVSAILGSLAMGMMFDANNIPKDLKMNGQYYAFKMLGEYYGLGNILLVIYALANMAAQISSLVFSIDAPLKVLLADSDKRYVPEKLAKINDIGTPINGYKLTAVLVSILIILPAIGIGDMNTLFNWLLDLNSIVMPLRYLWVFLAYMALKKSVDGKFHSGYKFIKSKNKGFIVGLWCFVFTVFACIMGMFPKGVTPFSREWKFQITLNLLTPFILIGLGFILPIIAKRKSDNSPFDVPEDKKIA
ncbi:amino acid permease family protein [Clostridium putrefaciens]|uniref:Amino acid permease family protein n=1 Tax=Clostridium putrefaciens TaxID=99675 RepID=A0A381J7L1_9CLOT|nr:amino acid permease [Clostridium putrefaciens]SUY46218.1 amino acid permease family protein [Clostridium putrefaciens]